MGTQQISDTLIGLIGHLKIETSEDQKKIQPVTKVIVKIGH